MPKENQIALIEEFVKVSHYEKSLKKFGMNYIYLQMFKDENGKEIRILSTEQAESILKNFNFNSFKEKSIYNAFSLVSEENLKALIEFYKSPNARMTKFGDLFINNDVIILNFISYLNKQIEEYTKDKK
ncbi:hypothetical protein [Chryseobacterium sp. IHB B 17019]|uniref:hypothetical protein n=1 Tax=Chryseobacterium sp. IHB B 17019 TaxID=1721091 RepID=UPI0012372F26|nr:hypothetical protein [Chryseobacterium sp. IHB B 17019]